MSEFQRQILFVGVATIVAIGLLLWSVTGVRYRITRRHLRVTWLGVPVRWISLARIKRVGNKPVLWAERWPNVLFDHRRTLVIRRENGLFKNFLITPKYPFEFKAALEQARAAVLVAGARNAMTAKVAAPPTPTPPPPAPAPRPDPLPPAAPAGGQDTTRDAA